MYHEDTEMLFPMRVIPALKDLRGIAWKRLVINVTNKEEDDPETLAFGLMMVRICGCMTCQADSFRALRGCTTCARQAVMRFRGTDRVLVRQFELSRKEVQAFLQEEYDV
jgi:hypothetical protein